MNIHHTSLFEFPIPAWNSKSHEINYYINSILLAKTVSAPGGWGRRPGTRWVWGRKCSSNLSAACSHTSAMRKRVEGRSYSRRSILALSTPAYKITISAKYKQILKWPTVDIWGFYPGLHNQRSNAVYDNNGVCVLCSNGKYQVITSMPCIQIFPV